MKKTFVVVGLGTFGAVAASALYKGGATVIAVDHDEKAVNRMKKLSTQAICVDIDNEEALESVGVFDANVVILALRRHFDTSVLATHMFKNHGVNEIVVHVDSEREASAILSIGATETIFPERDMAEHLAQRLLRPELAKQIPLSPDTGIIELPCPDDFVDHSLAELQIRKRFGVTVIAIKRPKPDGGDDKLDAAPSPDDVISSGSTLIVLGKTKHLHKFAETVSGK
ncbi:MAG TPA: TrkA family potassium uptake protein [Candidatus Hydrogenedentes bacterium]|nr:TrkA family potassium uptake protein [Candidatus Hydrogenedentota bacterium]